jgi:hypothetical protein
MGSLCVGCRREGWDLWKVMRSYPTTLLNGGRGDGPSLEGSLQEVDAHKWQVGTTTYGAVDMR